MSFVGLKRQDVAALVVVADPQPTMHHGLKTDFINLKWILKRNRKERSSLVEASSVQRKHDPLDALKRTEEESDAIGGGAASQSRERGNRGELSPQIGGEIQVSGLAEASTIASPNSSFSVEPDTQDQTMVDDIRRQFNGQGGTRNLLTLDPHAVCVAASAKHEVLLDSPRSVFIVLSNGHSVAHICKADQQEFYNEALRTGIPLDMVNLRIAAENKRRLQRYHSLRTAYVDLCSKLSSEALVEAIRDQKFGNEIEAAKNRQRMKNVPRYAYYGGEDLGVFDEDCQRLLEHARNKTVDEVRSVLEQNEKKIQQQNERERNADQDISALEAERRALEMKERDQRDRSRAIQKRADQFRQRVQRIREEQEESQEDLRRRVEVKQQEQEEFLEHQFILRKHLSMSSFEAQQQKRVQIRQTVAAKDEARRQDLIRRSEYLTQLHQREQDRRKEQQTEANRHTKEALNERGRVTRLLAAVQLEEKRMKSEFAIAQSNERAEQFKKTRAMRFEARKQLVEERKERGAQARQLAEEKRVRKAQELEMDYERKQQYIADMNEEHQREMALQKELNKQSRLIQKDEQQRCKQVNIFHSIGYLADGQAKADWLERENEKRRLLALQVKQERDALYRARDIVLQQVEESEVQRKKRETFAKVNSGSVHLSSTGTPLPSSAPSVSLSSVQRSTSVGDNAHDATSFVVARKPSTKSRNGDDDAPQVDVSSPAAASQLPSPPAEEAPQQAEEGDVLRDDHQVIQQSPPPAVTEADHAQVLSDGA